MNHAQLRAFHAVATEGSFTKAARSLGVSQPAVTIQVKALEESYGVGLIDRRGHRLTLTDLGDRLLEVTRRIFDLEEEVEALLSTARELRSGQLHVAADGPYFVMELLATFIARYPEVRVSVSMGNSDEVLQALIDYRADVAVLARIDDDRRFHALPIGHQPLVVLVWRAHPWAGREAIRLTELDGEAMVLREPGSVTRRIFDGALAVAGVRPRVVLEIGSREALREAVAAGLGAGVVSRAELGADDRLVALAVEDAELVSREDVVCLKERHNRRTVRAFFKLADTATGPR